MTTQNNLHQAEAAAREAAERRKAELRGASIATTMQRWTTHSASPSDSGGFVAYSDYLELKRSHGRLQSALVALQTAEPIGWFFHHDYDDSWEETREGARGSVPLYRNAMPPTPPLPSAANEMEKMFLEGGMIEVRHISRQEIYRQPGAEPLTEAAEKNAARYRWIRQKNRSEFPDRFPTDAAHDAAIDSAMGNSISSPCPHACTDCKCGGSEK